METPKVYFPYCPTCDDWTRPHRTGFNVYCAACGTWRAYLPAHATLPFGKYKQRSVYHMDTAAERSYLNWFLDNVEHIALNLRLAMLFQLGLLPDNKPKVVRPWWADLLGLTLPTTADAVKDAYRTASKVCHPDVGGSTEQMQQLNQAKETALQSLS